MKSVAEVVTSALILDIYLCVRSSLAFVWVNNTHYSEDLFF